MYTLNGLGGMGRGKCGKVWATLKHEVFKPDVVEMGSRRVVSIIQNDRAMIHSMYQTGFWVGFAEIFRFKKYFVLNSCLYWYG